MVTNQDEDGIAADAVPVSVTANHADSMPIQYRIIYGWQPPASWDWFYASRFRTNRSHRGLK